jgi:putative transposase
MTVTTEEGQACGFVAVDHCTAECIGIHASLSGNRFEALEPLRQEVREQFGGFDKASPRDWRFATTMAALI